DLDVGPEAGLFVIMEYVQSESLGAVLARQGRLDPAGGMDVVARVADLLESVHTLGILHREVRPGRVLGRPDGTGVLSVFGLTHPYESPRSGILPQVGSVRYVSPEQLMGQVPGVPSDVYSLGVIAYHCLAGRTPFDGESPIEVALRIVKEEPPPLP